MKRILLPTDFSRNAWNAISYALEFFKNEECKFFFLHAYTPAFYRMDYMLGGPAFSAIPDVGIDISLSGLVKTLEEAKFFFPNPKHSYTTISAFNILTDEINEVAKQENIDMVVMGTQGATGAKEIFLGSNTVYVIRKAKIPILAIPENYNFKKIQKILFPSGYWTLYNPKELIPLVETVKMYKAKITVIHVLEEDGLTIKQEENKEFLRETLEPYYPIFEDEQSKHMPEAIHDYIIANDFNLLAMMNRKHTFLERLFLKQNVDSIGFHVKVPFLVMPDTGTITK